MSAREYAGRAAVVVRTVAVAAAMFTAVCYRPGAPQVTVGRWALVGETSWVAVEPCLPEGGSVAFRCRVDRSVLLDWCDFVAAGVGVELALPWDSAGNRTVEVQAQDDDGLTSAWSAACTVHVLPQPGYPDMIVGSVEFVGEMGPAVLSPDGSRLFYEYSLDGDLMIRAMATSVNQVVASRPLSDWVSSMVCSPDGERLYYSTEDSLFAVSTSDLSVAAAVQRDEAGHLMVSPQGDPLYAVCEDRIAVIDAVSLATIDTTPLGMIGYPVAALSPDGRFLAVVDADAGRLWVHDAATLERRGPVATATAYCDELAFSLCGEWLYVCGEMTSVVRTRDWVLAGVLPTECEGPCRLFPDGRTLFFAESGDGVCVVRATNGLHEVIGRLLPEYEFEDLLFLPDGSRAYAVAHPGLLVLGYRDTEAE